MSNYYNPQRTRNLFNSLSNKPFEISRSQIDLFMRCPRCFYLDRKLGTSTPPGFPFSLNSAVDKLLKKEFDIFRKLHLPHPTMTYFGVNCIPFDQKDIDIWRDSLRGGVRYLHVPTNLIIKGGVDDLWINTNNEIHIVDYKATSKSKEVNIDADWQAAYKRQVEIYEWLFRRNGFRVSDTAYFVYCNADTSKPAFQSELAFDLKIIPYRGDDSWIDKTIVELRNCLLSPDLPDSGPECEFCDYFNRRMVHESKFQKLLNR